MFRAPFYAPILKPKGRPATPVIVAEVRQEPLQENIALVGRIQPRHSAQVASESEGLVLRRYKEGGQIVQGGEPLFQLANDVLRASLTEARADFKLRKSNDARSVELLETDAASEAGRARGRIRKRAGADQAAKFGRSGLRSTRWSMDRWAR